jgi:hypothetical protein
MDSVQDRLAAGFPHSDIHGSKPARGSPWLFAACHVLHRLSVPRHPPDALVILDPRRFLLLRKQDATRAQGRTPANTTGTSQRCDPIEPGQPSERSRAPPADPPGSSVHFASSRCQRSASATFRQRRPAASPRVVRKGLDHGRETGDRIPRSERRVKGRKPKPTSQSRPDSTDGRHQMARTRWPEPDGGGGRDRTDDLMLAKHALSQLSYAPEDRLRRSSGA